MKYALTSLAHNKTNINILLRVDNTKAIAYTYVNKMGSVQYPNLTLAVGREK